MSSEDFEKYVQAVSYRFGKLSVERKDLDGSSSPSAATEGPAKNDMKVEANISFDERHVRAQFDIILDTDQARFAIVSSGSWEIKEGAAEDEQACLEFGKHVALPRLLATSFSEISLLARQVDVSVPKFDHSFDMELRKAVLEPQQSDQ